MCSITGHREKLLKIFGQIGLHQLGTISVKSLVSLNACVHVIYCPLTAKVIRRRAQFIVSSERLDYKSSSLTTRPQRLLSFKVSCSQVSGSGSLSLLYLYSICQLDNAGRNVKVLFSFPGIGGSVGIPKMLQFLCLSCLCDGQGTDRRAILSSDWSCSYQ